MKHFYLISYDISNDKRRLKVMKALEDYGTRVQYSVFECWLRPKDLDNLKKRLLPHINSKDWDSIRFYSLCVDDVLRTDILGRGQVTSDPSFYLQ
jgi:CRISPR-associated protein Cas2